MAKKPEIAATASLLWARRVVVGGGGLSLLAASVISFEGLSGLGQLIGIYPSWLLPLAIDIYTMTCTITTLLLPPGSTRNAALGNAVLGLVMSMGGNAGYRALTHGWSKHTIALMVADSFPSLIVERLMHLQGAVARAVAGAIAAVCDATRGRATATVMQPVAPASVARPVAQPVAAAPVAQPAVAGAKPQAAPAATMNATAQRVAVAQEPAVAKPAAAKRNGNSQSSINKIGLALIAQHGIDNVKGTMLADAVGMHRSNGHRHIERIKKELAAGKLELPIVHAPQLQAAAP